jgi:hypothetical protein
MLVSKTDTICNVFITEGSMPTYIIHQIRTQKAIVGRQHWRAQSISVISDVRYAGQFTSRN